MPVSFLFDKVVDLLANVLFEEGFSFSPLGETGEGFDLQCYVSQAALLLPPPVEPDPCEACAMEVGRM